MDSPRAEFQAVMSMRRPALRAAASSVFLIIAFFTLAHSSEKIIMTIAGGGSDRVHALQASLGNWIPTVALDQQGNIYVPVLRLGTPVACAVGTVLGALPGQQLTHVQRIDPARRLTIVAGNGWELENRGDGGPALGASLSAMYGAALDAQGNLFLSGGNRIRRVDAATDIITAFAGNGTYGFSGDGGPAIEAGFEQVLDLHFDPAGNLYVRDLYTIRRIDALSGIITTVAGNGLSGYTPDGAMATAASLNSPRSFVVDGLGNVYIGEVGVPGGGGGGRVRFVSSSTGLLSTVAGNGTYGFSGDGGPATAAGMKSPEGLALDSHGNLFIADYLNSRVRRVDAVTGNITSFVLPCSVPEDVAVDPQDDLIVACDVKLFHVATSSGVVTHIAGVGPYAGDGSLATGAVFNGPTAVAVDSTGNVYVSDATGTRIRRVSAATGIIDRVAGGGTGGDGSPALSARVNYAAGVAVDQAGNLYIAESAGHDIGCSASMRVRKVEATTGIISTYAGNGTWGFSGDGGPATTASLYGPMGMAFNPDGSLLIADSVNQRIRRVDAATGIITTVAGGGTGSDGGPATSASLSAPFGVAADLQGNMFITEPSSNRVRRVDAVTGIITTVAGTGVQGYGGDGGPATQALLNLPTSVAVDASGQLFIADRNNDRIRQVNLDTGIITTLVGDAGPGFSGDTGPVSLAQLDAPHALALAPDGSLIVADNQNNRVRRISTQPSGAGRVPCESWTPEPPLTLKMKNGSLSMSWGRSCLRTDQDYVIYEGNLRGFPAHTARTCSTGGARLITLAPHPENAYYLVVPRNLMNEGSYGLGSDDFERPASPSACLPQEVVGSF